MMNVFVCLHQVPSPTCGTHAMDNIYLIKGCTDSSFVNRKGVDMNHLLLGYIQQYSASVSVLGLP